jgi:hypothetical protein
MVLCLVEDRLVGLALEVHRLLVCAVRRDTIESAHGDLL